MGELIRRLDGEVKIVRAYDCGVKPCVDCRFCWENNGCAIKDGMQAIYEDIRADNIVVASPMHFTELTGQLLAVLSRLQTFGRQGFKAGGARAQEEKGGIIIVRGGVGVLEQAQETAEALLLEMNAQPVGVVFADNSMLLPSAKVHRGAEENPRAGGGAQQPGRQGMNFKLPPARPKVWLRPCPDKKRLEYVFGPDALIGRFLRSNT